MMTLCFYSIQVVNYYSAEVGDGEANIVELRGVVQMFH